MWAVDIPSGESERLFQNARIGNLAINPQNHALWGVQIRHSQSALVILPFPYRNILPLTALPVGTILTQLQIHPNGKSMLATLRSNAISYGKGPFVVGDLSPHARSAGERKFPYHLSQQLFRLKFFGEKL